MKSILKISEIVCLVLLFWGCSAQKQEKRKEQVVALNDSMLIDSLGLRQQFIDWKWKIYCVNCDQKLNFLDSTIHDTVAFGTLPLKFDGLEKKKDTVILDFMFFYNDSISCVPGRVIKNRVIYSAAYKLGVDTPLYYFTSDATFTVHCLDTLHCDSRYVKPLQPEVIEYIRKNKEVIDPWLRAEAVKRGVIED